MPATASRVVLGFGGDFDGRIGDRQKPPGGWVGRQHFIQEGGGEPLKREPQHNNLLRAVTENPGAAENVGLLLSSQAGSEPWSRKPLSTATENRKVVQAFLGMKV